MRPPRLFNLMLTAFALVIVLGVSGMALSFWLVMRWSNPNQTRWFQAEMAAHHEAERLAAYYRQTRSWRRVEQQLGPLNQRLGDIAANVTLLDDKGRVVAGRRRPPILRGNEAIIRVPITVEHAQVGTLVFSVVDTEEALPTASFNRRPLTLGLLSAGVGLMAVLLTLAAIFSRQISTPLRQISIAAHAIAAGDHGSRVQPANVRELADLAASFNQMAEALQRADQQRRQLTADIAHELRTPLSIIKGQLEGIQDGVYEANSEQINSLLAEVALLERLINDLHLLALADAGQLPLYPESIAPATLVNEAARSFSRRAVERGIQLSTTIEEGLPELMVDPQRITQVLGNLLSNALRYTPPGGKVEIVARACPDGVIFSVHDTGPGIDPADLPHIFDRFYRADRSRNRSSGGSGLGLVIARRLVEAHGGQIWAESVSGQGTIIYARLPVTRSVAAIATALVSVDAAQQASLQS